MDDNLNKINNEVYTKCGLKISDFQIEHESKEYNACRFDLNGQKIISRNSKITPKKVGQFVTFWKRNEKGPIEPFEENDPIDFYTVNVRTENDFGQFVFPKSVLIKKGIISTTKKEGKRAFRVYPNWDIAKNKQAERTQKWQLEYFYIINDAINLKKVVKLYTTE
ncbi:MepB family protein [Nonlabens arenilitoris]|uniref:MepB family protein n=2 Tax=Nonlabens arenilitoris TaxID=1217969 RepID=A0A2S7UE49_9FLAO|nr:MepB family protein [Nonlabens arenilitoris]